MSASDGPLPTSQMIVTGPAGMDIQILSASRELLARGEEQVTRTLPEGLYFVRWSASDAVREEVAYLRGIPKPLQVAFPGAPDENRLEGLQSVVPLAEAEPGRAAVVILEQSDDPRLKGPPLEDIALFDTTEQHVAADSAAVDRFRQENGQDTQTGAGWTLAVYLLKPGAYRLRYLAVSGFTLYQSLVAFEGRRTVVILRPSLGHALVGGKSVPYSALITRGVDAPRTTILTVPRTEAGVPATVHQRLAEGLLDAIASGGDPLSATTLGHIEEPNGDPLLMLYAAVLILAALDRDSSPAWDDPWPPSDGDPGPFRARWTQRARSLLAGLPPEAGAFPDVRACRLRLGDPDAPAPDGPPMLAPCWDWMNVNPQAAPSSLRVAAAGRDTAGPWLTCRATLGKTGAVESAPPPPLAPAVLVKGVEALQHALTRDPPALKLPVVNFDDPQKNRFGGRASVDGFTVSAHFDEEEPDWIEIRLEVAAEPGGPATDGDPAVFYLHNTFDPDRLTRRFRGGRARLTLHAFGGFTVGVWLPKRQIQLELDLAGVPGAPRAIREW